MTERTLPGATEADRELHIELWFDCAVYFSGSAAQLQEEGLIPEGFKWPTAAGPRDARWEVGQYSYWLYRKRPKGHKGPARSWLALDHWALRVSVTGRGPEGHALRALERKTKELRAEWHRQTPDGAHEWHRFYGRYMEALRDEAFQRFKAKVPALVPAPRGRRGRPAQA